MEKERKSIPGTNPVECNNRCENCDSEGKINNEEVCPICGGSGCSSKKYLPWIVEGGNKYLWCDNCIFIHV